MIIMGDNDGDDGDDGDHGDDGGGVAAAVMVLLWRCCIDGDARRW